MTRAPRAPQTRTWLELAGPAEAPEWVLHTRDRLGRCQVAARMPAPPARGRSPHTLLIHDRMQDWVARHIQATSVVLRRGDHNGRPTWHVQTGSQMRRGPGSVGAEHTS